MAESTPIIAENDALELLRAIATKDDSRTSLHAVYAAMIAFSVACLERDMNQTAADTLAFLLQDSDVSTGLRDEAAEIFDDLERRICPRVILDARTFAEGMDLPTMLEYLLDLIASEAT